VFKIRTKHLNTFLDDFAEQHLSRVGKWIVTGDIRPVEGSRTGKMGSFWAGGKKEVYDEISSFRSGTRSHVDNDVEGALWQSRWATLRGFVSLPGLKYTADMTRDETGDDAMRP